MLMAEVIRPHDLSSLRDYHLANLKQGGLWLPDDELVSEIPIPAPMPAGLLKRIYSRASRALRLSRAAKKWLKPGNLPSAAELGYEDLTRLRRSVGLEHYTVSAFVSLLVDACHDVGTKHPRLKQWVDCRTSLLELDTKPFTQLPSRLYDVEKDLRRALLSAMRVSLASPEMAVNICRSLIPKALNAAGHAATCVLGRTRHDGEPTTRIHVNMMLPLLGTDELYEASEFGHVDLKGPEAQRWSENAKAASELWRGHCSERDVRLQVVAETDNGNYGGFWVPAIKGERPAPGNDHVPLPGAATAYLKIHGSAVFIRDIPPLIGFKESLRSKWEAYLSESFRQDLFVSLPLAFPSSNRPEVASVINIDVELQPEDRWWRAYHRAWLDIATEEVSDFAEIAYYAALIYLDCSTRSGNGGRTPKLPSAVAEEALYPLVRRKELSPSSNGDEQ